MNIQQDLFFFFLKKIIKINCLKIVLIKMRILVFLVFSHHGLTCKYGIIFQISICKAHRIAFSNT